MQTPRLSRYSVFAVTPEDLLGRRIDGHERAAEAEVGLRVLVVVALPHAPRPMSQARSVASVACPGGLPRPRPGRRDAVLQRHPLPHRAVGHAGGNHDLVLIFAGRARRSACTTRRRPGRASTGVAIIVLRWIMNPGFKGRFQRIVPL